MPRKETIGYAIGALGATLLLVITQQASAGPIRIAFDATSDGAEDWSGNTFTPPNPSFDDGIDFSAQTVPGVAQGSLTFNMIVGTTIYSDYCIAEDGALWLTTAACAATPTGAVFNVLGGLDWVSVASDQAPSPGVVSVSPGLVDRESPISSADYVDTLRFLWNGVTLAGGDSTEFFFQARFFDLGLGNFDVDFSYGDSEFVTPYAIGTQSIVDLTTTTPTTLFLGSQPFAPLTDYVFRFEGGVCTAGCTTKPPPNPVPEPSTLLLFSSALLGLAFRRKRRAASSAP